MRYAICNELFEGWDFKATCKAAAKLGYAGIEVAPFTLAPLITDVSAAQRRELRKIARDCKIEIIGLHWLLAKTEGFHLNANEPAIRAKTAGYLCALAHACADLGGSLMVFGSPAARKIPAGTSWEQALGNAADTLRQCVHVLEQRGVRLLIEPLAPTETDFLQSVAEADELRQLVDHPNVALHLDVKAMSAEKTSIPELIRAYAKHTGHVHANDPNLRGPGMGDVNFVPIFAALEEVGYAGWVSVEVFDFKPDPETIAAESIAYMRRCETPVEQAATIVSS